MREVKQLERDATSSSSSSSSSSSAPFSFFLSFTLGADSILKRRSEHFVYNSLALRAYTCLSLLLSPLIIRIQLLQLVERRFDLLPSFLSQAVLIHSIAIVDSYGFEVAIHSSLRSSLVIVLMSLMSLQIVSVLPYLASTVGEVKKLLVKLTLEGLVSLSSSLFSFDSKRVLFVTDVVFEWWIKRCRSAGGACTHISSSLHLSSFHVVFPTFYHRFPLPPLLSISLSSLITFRKCFHH